MRSGRAIFCEKNAYTTFPRLSTPKCRGRSSGQPRASVISPDRVRPYVPITPAVVKPTGGRVRVQRVRRLPDVAHVFKRIAFATLFEYPKVAAAQNDRAGAVTGLASVRREVEVQAIPRGRHHGLLPLGRAVMSNLRVVVHGKLLIHVIDQDLWRGDVTIHLEVVAWGHRIVRSEAQHAAVLQRQGGVHPVTRPGTLKVCRPGHANEGPVMIGEIQVVHGGWIRPILRGDPVGDANAVGAVDVIRLVGRRSLGNHPRLVNNGQGPVQALRLKDQTRADRAKSFGRAHGGEDAVYGERH